MHATESFFFCLCGRGNTSKDALLFTDLFWFFNYCHSSLLLDGLSLQFSQGIFFLFLSVHLTFFFALFWVANFVALCPIKTLSLLAWVTVTCACRFAKKFWKNLPRSVNVSHIQKYVLWYTKCSGLYLPDRKFQNSVVNFGNSQSVVYKLILFRNVVFAT